MRSDTTSFSRSPIYIHFQYDLIYIYIYISVCSTKALGGRLPGPADHLAHAPHGLAPPHRPPTAPFGGAQSGATSPAAANGSSSASEALAALARRSRATRCASTWRQ